MPSFWLTLLYPLIGTAITGLVTFHYVLKAERADRGKVGPRFAHGQGQFMRVGTGVLIILGFWFSWGIAWIVELIRS